MNINTLTIKAQEALQAALNLARERGQQAVEPLHLLAVLIREDDSLATLAANLERRVWVLFSRPIRWCTAAQISEKV